MKLFFRCSREHDACQASGRDQEPPCSGIHVIEDAIRSRMMLGRMSFCAEEGNCHHECHDQARNQAGESEHERIEGEAADEPGQNSPKVTTRKIQWRCIGSELLRAFWRAVPSWKRGSLVSFRTPRALAQLRLEVSDDTKPFACHWIRIHELSVPRHLGRRLADGMWVVRMCETPGAFEQTKTRPGELLVCARSTHWQCPKESVRSNDFVCTLGIR